ENDPSLVAARCLRENHAQAARGDLTILSSCQAFFCIFEIFCGAGMPAAPAGNRECLNFSQTQLQGRIPLPITVEPYVPISR
ncbi:MAG TPA: hypothetical protein PL117_12675, partial [Accumulibacter sp.]|uniref:hypothetical protein n=1 Tax=Accumulibacter sp. TaxID=2053492 RepID=UPI002B5C1789